MVENKGAVLLCPLNWGLGHATRCIPLVMELIRQKKEVIIAADGAPLSLLRKEFPELQFIVLKGIKISYTKEGFSLFHLLMQFPKMLWGVYTEHRLLKEIIGKNNIGTIISDNRYGLFSPKIKSILITHQLKIKLPANWKWMEGVVNKVNRFFIAKFNECWVPDNKSTRNISGELSHNNFELSNVKYIGTLSRLSFVEEQAVDEIYEVLAIVSGPEPQRSVFENLLINKLGNTRKSVLIVRGKPEDEVSPAKIGNITLINHLSTAVIKFHLIKSEFLICRSGYSSLMDLAAIGRSAIIIPTPGQSEQEYLAEYLHERGNHFMLSQDSIDFGLAFNGIKNCRQFFAGKPDLESLLRDFPK